MRKLFKVLSTAALFSISSASMAQASDDPSKNVPASSIGSIRKAEVMHVTCPNGLMATSLAVCNGLTGNTIIAPTSVSTVVPIAKVSGCASCAGHDTFYTFQASACVDESTGQFSRTSFDPLVDNSGYGWAMSFGNSDHLFVSKGFTFAYRTNSSNAIYFFESNKLLQCSGY